MLPKKNRADSKAIKKIFKEGKVFNTPSLSFRFISNSDKDPKISFLAPKSVAKTAVKRNLLRRLGYRILKKHIALLPTGKEGAFIYKKYQEDPLIIENEVKSILAKIN